MIEQVAAAAAEQAVRTVNVGWDPTTITLVGGIILSVIGSVVTGTVTIITAMRVRDVKERTVENAGKIDLVAKDSEAIKGHVNSEKTAAQGRETTLQRENALLREMIADKQQTAALLAQAVTSRGSGSRASDHPVLSPLSGEGAVPVATPAPIQVEVVNVDPLSVDQVKPPDEVVDNNTPPA